ncbi:uncharacterized protein LOC114515639 isoform X2 [Dendronephthya gigantea]|nr:uncharacterized protein LOC114515639 isoform X2 [Dendronephthya gigantea]XP_028390735.1 uncharacterized protein LOC114515639 isoform X2 [Dendronephthya gigantea]
MGVEHWTTLFVVVTILFPKGVQMCVRNPACGFPSQFPMVTITGSTTYSPPDPITLECKTSSDVKNIRWDRLNRAGETKMLNSTHFNRSASGLGRLATLKDTPSPSVENFPYSYRCVAITKCCVKFNSNSVTVNLMQPTTATPTTNNTKSTLSIYGIDTTLVGKKYNGFGKVHVHCNGQGDNYTRVYWIVTADSNGKNETVNSTGSNFVQAKVWQAWLLYQPKNMTETYVYQCVVENKCCERQIKSLKIPYSRPAKDCPFLHKFLHVRVTPIPSKRSVRLTWIYDPDPKDKGFIFQVENFAIKELNITTREYVFRGLVPFKWYIYKYNIRYGDDCKLPLDSVGKFRTLPDIPSEARNISLAVKANALNVTWEPPKYTNGIFQHYTVLWKKTGLGEKYAERNVTSTNLIIENLLGYTSYDVNVRCVNHVGTSNSSKPISATTEKGLGPYIRIQTISSQLVANNFTGFGKVDITCTGEGNNRTKIRWVRISRNGNNITLNTTHFDWTNSDGSRSGTWKAVLFDNPRDRDKFPYKYLCVVLNHCCLMKTSSPLTINHTFQTAHSCPTSGVTKPIRVDVFPNRRSVKFSWEYHNDPEDNAFRFTVGQIQTEKLDVSQREYQVYDLVPYTVYNYSYGILYGPGCETKTLSGQFITLSDYPGIPRNVVVNVEGNSLYISWMRPEYLNGKFKHYVLSWKRSSEEYSKVNVTSTQYLIRNLDEIGAYSIKLQAVNDVGIGNSSASVSAEIAAPAGRSESQSSNAGAIAGGTIAALLVVIFALLVLYQLRKRNLQRERSKSIEKFHSWHLNRVDNPNNRDSMVTKQQSCSNNAEALPAKQDVEESISYIVLLESWEIAPDKLKLLDKKLGGGQFGIVKQGLLTIDKGDPEIVAVKALKSGASETDLQDLMTELTILKEVNKIPHPNVIKLIGGCTIEGKLHVITEFCPGGSLRSLLINSRIERKEEHLPFTYVNLASTLNHRQLLKIAADISSGMIHLSSQKFVHRDLAARNILIGDDNLAKVSDFGLARDVGGAEEYIRNNQNLLPVKWMALESLLHGRFTTASDVWSFGVLLYEITTLGEEPYKNISPYNIVSHVGSGCRMSQPQHCSDEVYEIMSNCWKVEASERPTFEEIHELLKNMLLDNEKSYINIANEIADEGSLRSAIGRNNGSNKDGSIRYTTA